VFTQLILVSVGVLGCYEQFERIQIGMPPAQVEKLMGRQPAGLGGHGRWCSAWSFGSIEVVAVYRITTPDLNIPIRLGGSIRFEPDLARPSPGVSEKLFLTPVCQIRVSTPNRYSPMTLISARFARCPSISP